jgi:RHS repeat-associated protein
MGYYLQPHAASCTSRNANPRSARALSGLRYYYPEMGRWVSADPLWDRAFKILLPSVMESRYSRGGADPNLYGFVGNSPIILLDPHGLQLECAAAQLSETVGEWGPWIATGLAAAGTYIIYESTRIITTVWQNFKEKCFKCEKAETETKTKEEKKTKDECVECTPYKKGTTGYLGPHDTSPDAPPGAPRPQHYNLFQVNQGPPPTCYCFWNRIAPHYSPIPGKVDCNGGFPTLSP